jgi:hypothetical protein
MREQILTNLDNPLQMEKLYREDKSAFKLAFRALSPELKDRNLVGFWNARLDYAREEISWGSGRDLFFVIILALVAGFIAKLPAILEIDGDFFYPRNLGFIVFPALAAYFARKRGLSAGNIALIAGAMLVGLVYINLLPNVKESDTLILSCVHLLLFLWSLLGIAYLGGKWKDLGTRLGFLKYNGDLLVMTALIMISGAILTGVTIGLFSLIGYNIEQFYFENIVIFVLPSAPILGTYLTQTNPQLVGKVSPVIARIFSPLVLVMLVIYLGAIIYSGKDPYNDRDFLLMFNGLLIGVMAIIFFSVAETSRLEERRISTWFLFLLSVVTIIVNGIALSAILFRISAWGMTPNRAAVLGGNILILVHLLLVAWQLFRVVSRKTGISGVGNVISSYLPVYSIWTIIVTFLFPLIFGFR